MNLCVLPRCPPEGGRYKTDSIKMLIRTHLPD
jgi:hypothetical protein